MSEIKLLIIPDVHGRSFWKKPVNYVLENNKDAHIVFLGDYTDPYNGEIDKVTKEAITKEDGFKSLKEVIEVKKNNPDRITLLLGNHDLGYVNGYICNTPKRIDYKNRIEIKHTIIDNIKLFDLAYETEINGQKFLLSHAGVTARWVPKCEELLRQYDRGFKFSVDGINRILHTQIGTNREANLVSVLSYCSFFRGGDDDCSSIVWGDIGDHLEEGSERWADDNGYIQVFGHTQLNTEPVTIDFKSYILDVRRPFYISTEGRVFDYDSGSDSIMVICGEERKKFYEVRMGWF